MKHEALSKNAENVSEILRSLAHPTRLKILCALLEGSKTVGELVDFSGGSQSGTSQFLGRMKREGLISSEKQGQFVNYSLADQKIRNLMKVLKESYC